MFNLIKRLSRLIPSAEAHCDTAEGPAVTDGGRALETGNLNHALKWVPADGEAELRQVFDKAMAVRRLAVEAVEVGDRLFLETLVRVHRMAEGVGFTGIQPGGAEDPLVVAADRALADGDLEPLRALVPPDRFTGLAARFRSTRDKRDFDVDDVAAGRDFVAAYTSYFKYAEGEEHTHGHQHDAGHEQHGHGHRS
jgi:hypothetical protein